MFDKTINLEGPNSELTVVAGSEGLKSLTIRCNGVMLMFDEVEVQTKLMPILEGGLISWAAAVNALATPDVPTPPAPGGDA